MSAPDEASRPLGQPGRRRGAMPFVAVGILLLVVAVLWTDVLLRARLVASVGSSGYSTTAGVVISAVAAPIIVGLLLRATWAWWVGLIAAAWQLTSHLLYLIVQTASGEPVGALSWVIALLLIVFLAVLLLPATREACFK